MSARFARRNSPPLSKPWRRPCRPRWESLQRSPEPKNPTTRCRPFRPWASVLACPGPTYQTPKLKSWLRA